ncbi:MAG: CotH kinase family protein [Myxococcota bacterium]|nr:CotH kinase family protein [Myxococcota bacterium]
MDFSIVHRRVVALAGIGLVAGCVMETLPPRPAGWTEETHGNDVPPNYEAVFPAGTVPRIDIEIAPNDWLAMWEDMTANHGEFGAGGRPVREVPPEALAACDGRAAGDDCVVPTPTGGEEPGICAWVWENTLLACESSGGGDPMEVLAAACAGRSSRDACTVSFMGSTIEGVCLQADRLICAPQEMMQACQDRPAGESCGGTLFGREFQGRCGVLEGVSWCQPERGPPPGPGDLSVPEPVWVSCTVRFEGRTWRYVGVRFKGNSSLTHTWESGSLKLPFRLHFDRLEDRHPEIDDQRFFGFQKLSFAGNFRDDSYLREKVVGDLFREGGVPAPRSAFYRVFFDVGAGSEYRGLYAMVEVPGRPMFITQFGGDGGNLYKPVGAAATWQAGLPLDDTSFDKQTNEAEADWSDAEGAIAALHADRTDAAAWRIAIERLFDVDGFLRWLAINTVLQDWDTYGIGPHNYYLYGDPAEGGRLHWIPWDHSEALRSRGGMRPPLPLDMSTVTNEWPLIRYLIDDPVYAERYWVHVGAFAEGTFRGDAVRARMQAEHDRIAAYVVGPEGEVPESTTLSSPEAFDRALDELLAHVDRRQEDVQTALDERAAGAP